MLLYRQDKEITGIGIIMEESKLRLTAQSKNLNSTLQFGANVILSANLLKDSYCSEEVTEEESNAFLVACLQQYESMIKSCSEAIAKNILKGAITDGTFNDLVEPMMEKINFAVEELSKFGNDKTVGVDWGD